MRTERPVARAMRDLATVPVALVPVLEARGDKPPLRHPNVRAALPGNRDYGDGALVAQLDRLMSQ